MIDLMIVAVLAVSIILGWSRGMMRGILSLAGMLVAIAVASQAADVLADGAVEHIVRPALHEAIEERIDEMAIAGITNDFTTELSRLIDGIENDFIREEAHKLLYSLGLSGETARDALLETGEEVVDTVVYGAVREILSAVLCLILFALLSLALRPVLWLGEQAFKLPLLHQMDQLGGLVLGTLRGAVLVLVLLWAAVSLRWIEGIMLAGTFLARAAAGLLSSWGFLSL